MHVYTHDFVFVDLRDDCLRQKAPIASHFKSTVRSNNKQYTSVKSKDNLKSKQF